MNVAYFPGCSLHGTAREYDISTRLVCNSLGVRLDEVDDWNCCGATASHGMDHGLTLELNRRNLTQVAKMGLDRITTPCAGCFNRLKTASVDLGTATPEVDGQENKEIGEGSGKTMPRVLHLLQFLAEEIGLDHIIEPVKTPLKGLKLAAYYGCLITRPRRIVQFDDSEQPQSMDRILEALGAQTVSWSHKAECCGGAFAVPEVGIVLDLGQQVLEAARDAGAEAVVVACPMCQLNLDSRQEAFSKAQTIRPDLPIIYFTQLIALAYGHPVRRAGLKRLLVDPLPLLRRKNLV